MSRNILTKSFAMSRFILGNPPYQNFNKTVWRYYILSGETELSCFLSDRYGPEEDNSQSKTVSCWNFLRDGKEVGKGTFADCKFTRSIGTAQELPKQGGSKPCPPNPCRPSKSGPSDQTLKELSPDKPPKSDGRPLKTQKLGDTKPQKPGDSNPQNSGDSKPQKPSDSKLQKPDEYKPQKPVDSKPQKPVDSKPQKPGDSEPQKPDDPKPQRPDNSEPPEPYHPKPQRPDDSKPDDPKPPGSTQTDKCMFEINKEMKICLPLRCTCVIDTKNNGEC